MELRHYFKVRATYTDPFARHNDIDVGVLLAHAVGVREEEAHGRQVGLDTLQVEFDQGGPLNVLH